MIQVQISELNATTQRTFLPYVWGTLRSYCAHFYPEINESVEWLDPLYDSVASDEAFKSLAGVDIDVLGLSCYTWNWARQRDLAQRIKETSPECLIVAGGPHPDYNSESFFLDNPFIDIVVVADGEIPFTRILECVVAGESNFADIPGVVAPDQNGLSVMKHPPEKPTSFPPSPYLEFSNFYESIIQDKPERCSLVWETNRGCPYQCSFCDWGSATMSKIWTFDMGRVQAEATWVFKQAIMAVFLADANFGILPRDMEIASLLEDLRQLHQGPNHFIYNPDKNNPKRTSAIARKFARAKLATTHYVAVQHTDACVLKATNRVNISTEKQKNMVREMLLEGVPLGAQLILGIPGDTRDKWEQVFADLMEWSVHDDYIVSEYIVLPNAPIATPALREKWQYETICRFTRDLGVEREKTSHRNACIQADLIVASASFTSEDWTHMRVYSEFVTALHNAGYTRRIAEYLHFSHGISFRDFYNSVINDFCRNDLFRGSWWQEIKTRIETFLVNEEAFDDIELTEIPDLSFYLKFRDWILAKTGLESAAFFAQLKTYLLDRFPDYPKLASVIDYQQQLLITPDYDYE
ncbi:MAG: hypothetical protein DRH08_11690, partial [Deltaproteobacteria bacterium]